MLHIKEQGSVNSPRSQGSEWKSHSENPALFREFPGSPAVTAPRSYSRGPGSYKLHGTAKKNHLKTKTQPTNQTSQHFCGSLIL